MTQRIELFFDDSKKWTIFWNMRERHCQSRPSLTLRTALSAIPFVCDPCGVDVQWFQERSSEALPNSKDVSVIDFRFPPGSKNFCKLLSVSWEVFVLHGYDWIHWVASLAPRLHVDDCFEIHNFHWELCDLLLSSHQNFLHEVRLRHCVFCTGPLWFWSSGKSRNFGLSGHEYKHCVYPIPHFSYALKIIHEKNSRVSLCVRELCHPQDSLNSCNIPVYRNNTGLPVLARDSHFYLILESGLVYSTNLLMFQNNTGLAVLTFRHFHLTRLQDGDPFHTGLTVLVYPHFRLTTSAGGWSEWSICVEGVMGVKVDELEEDLEWSISCFKGVMGVYEIWFLTVDPFVWVSVFIAKLSWR